MEEHARGTMLLLGRIIQLFPTPLTNEPSTTTRTEHHRLAKQNLHMILLAFAESSNSGEMRPPTASRRAHPGRSPTRIPQDPLCQTPPTNTQHQPRLAGGRPALRGCGESGEKVVVLDVVGGGVLFG